MEYKHFNIIVPSYNNSKWYEQNILSCVGQDYPTDKFNIIYTDDNSQDGTADLVENLINKNNYNNIKLIRNEKNVGALCNIYNMIHSCDDKSISFTVDGDDWLSHKNVLNKLNEIYQNENVWMTYGSYLDYPSMTKGCCKPYEDFVINAKGYRKVTWRASHLRSWYTKLFKMIKEEDFKFQDEWADVAWDLLIQFPCLEICNGKYKCIEDGLYIYNNQNPISDYKIKQSRQGMIDGFARSKKPYNSIDKLW